MRAAEELKRQSEQRRRNAELRTSYGNALSESNLRQMRQHVEGGNNNQTETGVVSILKRQPTTDFIASPPVVPRNYGTQSNAYSWQLNTASSPRFQALAPRPTSASMSTSTATSTATTSTAPSSRAAVSNRDPWDQSVNNCDRIARHYEVLQKRAQQNTRLMEQVRFSSSSGKGEKQGHRVQFMDN